MENLLDQPCQKDVLNEMEAEVFPVNLKNAFVVTFRICRYLLLIVEVPSYERVVATIYKKSGPQQEAAVRIIDWVACAKRPLRWGEVQATFFIDLHTGSSDFQGRRLRKSCKRLCGSLIDVTKKADKPEAEAILTLVHDTARE